MGRMNPGMKMMMMQRATEQRSRSEYTGNGNNRRMIGYDRPENAGNRGEDNRGRYRSEYEGNDMRRYAERDNYSEGRYMPSDGWREPMTERYQEDNYSERMEPEGRRRRSSRTGRFIRGAYGGEMEEDEAEYRPKSHYGAEYGDIYAKGMIYAPGAMNRPGGGMQSYPPVNEEKARKWVRRMSKGEKFPTDQAEQVRNTHCPDCSKWEFYVAINAMYSDYCETAKKFNLDKPEFYAMLARDFLMDDDAGPNKLSKYMEYIPEK